MMDLLFSSIWVPDRRDDGAVGAGGALPEVVDGDHLPVRALDTARIPQVAAGAVLTQGDLRLPGVALVTAEAGAHAVGSGAVAVGEAEASIRQADHTGWIAAARVRH